jgi:hypothetical protein
MTRQQRQRLVDVRPVMKNQQKSLIQTTNALHVNHAVHAMIVAIAEIVHLAVSNHQMNLQNQLSMSVPTVNR